MLTNIDLDEEKIKEIMELKNFKTKKEAVNAAIDNFLRVLSASELLKMKGSNVWEGNLDEIRKD
jgi:Arc/MetJ family transcription regulator